MSLPIISRPPKQQVGCRTDERQLVLERFKEDEKDMPEQQEKKKKRKKKVGTKEERRLKREAEKLKNLYAPKCSHIQMITPELMQKIKGENSTRSQCAPSALSSRGSQKGFNNSNRNKLSSQTPFEGHPNNSKLFESTSSCIDFPTLSISAATASTSKNITLKATSSRIKINESSAKILNDDSGWETDPGNDDFLKSEDRRMKASKENVLCQPEKEHLPEIPVVSKRKPSKKPMVVSMNELIESKKEIRTCPKIVEKRKRKEENEKFTVGNLLDSSGPVVMNRGKIRERPKIKRKTPLKKAIMKTRALRKANITTKFPNILNSKNATELPSASTLDDTVAVATTSHSQERQEDSEKSVENGKQSFSSPNNGNNNINIVNTGILEKNLSAIESDCILSPCRSQSNTIENSEADIFSKKIQEIIKYAEESAKRCDNVEVPKDLYLNVKAEMHSKKFRPYCDMYTSKDLHGKIWELLKELHRLQDRLYHTDPLKYKIKKRYVHGLKDVYSHLKVNKLQLIIIAADIEPNNEKGGLDEKLETIINIAQEKHVPYIFSGNRYILGKPIRINTPVSAIGILDYQAADELCKKILDEAHKLREEYQADFSERLLKLKL